MALFLSGGPGSEQVSRENDTRALEKINRHIPSFSLDGSEIMLYIWGVGRSFRASE